MKRPKTWKGVKEARVIDSSLYDMNKVHQFIRACLSDSHQFEFLIKTDLLKKTGLVGIVVSDLEQVFIDGSIKKKDLYLTILHEISHCFFNDDLDSRKKIPKYNEDPVEMRAESSAENIYKWYRKKKNYSKFCEFRLLISFLPREKLSAENMEDLS